MKKILLLVCALLVAFGIHAQNVTVSGTVTSAEDNSPLPGVSVVLKGSTSGVGTATDADGKYSLSVPSTDGVLVFSYIGFKTLEVQISGRTTVDFSMEPDATQLTEVVVSATGVERNSKEIVYANQTVKGEDLLSTLIRTRLKPYAEKQPVFVYLPVQDRWVRQHVSFFAVKVH